MKRIIANLLALGLLGACATGGDQYLREGAEDPPNRLAAAPRSVPRGQTFTWGGVILSVDNQTEHTVLEVLAYPLNTKGKPDTDAASQGRFLADRADYLDPKDYWPGRLLTVTGDLLGYQDGEIGGATYRFPALEVTRLRLWERGRTDRWRRPRIGVGVSGGSGGGGVGVGVGF